MSLTAPKCPTATLRLSRLRSGRSGTAIGVTFEVSVTEVPGTTPLRMGVEAVAVTLYRARLGRLPLANFGDMPAGIQQVHREQRSAGSHRAAGPTDRPRADRTVCR